MAVGSEKKTLAAAIQERKAWEVLQDHVQRGDFTEQGNLIWSAIGDYYGRDDGAKRCDIEILARRIGETLTSVKHRQTFEQLVAEIGALEVSPENVVYDFVAVKKEAVGSRLATELLQSGKQQEVRNLIEEYIKWDDTTNLVEEDESEIMRGLPIADLSRSYTEAELIKVWPLALNQKLDGGLLRGHHMIVFAPVEMGKTLFLVNATVGFLRQNLTVLYIGNEDPISDIALRAATRITGWSKYDVLENPEDADAIAREKGYDNLILAGLAPGSPTEIRGLVEKYDPDILVVDQLRNLRINTDNYVQKLERAATAVRNIGKEFGMVVVSATQAGDSASNKQILETGDVDFSNVGIPAQADVMVGIGADYEDQRVGRRVLSLPKNKRSGDHGFLTVRMDTTINKLKGFEA